MSDYREERLAARRAINAQNKRRSKDMETRVMRILSGNRVPMSGSGSIKGDGQIFSKFGYVLVECKCTAAMVKDRPCITLRNVWLSELDKDSASMHASFGILVLHLHNTRRDYALVKSEVFNKLLNKSNINVCDLPCEDHTRKKGWRMFKDYLDTVLAEDNSMIRVIMSHGEYLLMRLEYMKYLLENTTA